MIGLDGQQEAFLGQGFDDGEKLAGLGLGIDTGGLSQGGFGSEVDQVGAFRVQAAAFFHGGLGRKDNTLTIPRIRAEVDDAHQVGGILMPKGLTSELALGDPGLEVGGVCLAEMSQGFESKHATVMLG